MPHLDRLRRSSDLSFVLFLALLGALLLAACQGEPTTDVVAEATEDVPQATYMLVDGSTLTTAQIERYDDLTDDAYEAYDEGSFAACAEHYAAAEAIYGASSGTAYNLACCLALDGQADAAIATLERVADLGYTSHEHLASDSDLETLHDVEAFTQIVARVEANAAAREAEADETEDVDVDVAVGATDPTPSFDDLDALDSWYDDQWKTLRQMLGRDDRDVVLPRLRRSQMAALRAWAGVHADTAADAELRALEVHAGFSPPSPSLEAAIDSYLERHGDSPLAGTAQILLAESRFGEEVLGDPHANGHAAAVAAMAETARQVLAERPDTREAHLWIVNDALLRFDHDAAVKQYATLRELVPEDDTFWSQNGYALYGAKLLADGLPEYTATALDGRDVSVAALEGEVVLLDFWATWCMPCIEELPALKELYAEKHERGFEIVGFSADREAQVDQETFEAWIAEQGMGWPQVYDGQGWAAEVNQLFGIVGIPTTVLLDRDGSIAAVNLRGDALAARVAELL